VSAVSRIEGQSFLDDPRLKKLFDALDGNGEELRVVGGAVRNHLMGAPVTEVDLATTSEPARMIERADAAGLKCVPTGIEHGTVTIIVDHAPFEVTTLREDVETDGRRAKVVFGRDFRADALRRDFTFNALSVNAQGDIFDYAQGLRDIADRRVHFIGDPDARIREDYLRILRFFRFHSAFGESEADGKALAAIARNRNGLDGLSRERVRAEMLKLLETRAPAQTVSLMAGLGLVLPILGGIDMPVRLARLVEMEHARGAKPDALLRLAALAILTPEDAGRLREKLRLSNAEEARLSRAATARAHLHNMPPPDRSALLQLIYSFGSKAAADGLELAHAQSRAEAGDPSWAQARHFIASTAEPQRPFGGADLIALGAKPGKDLGKALAIAEKAWIDEGFPTDPAVLARILAAALAPRKN
jgi:poly(A) polymerase